MVFQIKLPTRSVDPEEWLERTDLVLLPFKIKKYVLKVRGLALAPWHVTHLQVHVHGRGPSVWQAAPSDLAVESRSPRFSLASRNQ